MLLFGGNSQPDALDADTKPAKGAEMTRITIPNMTPEHHATEISLQLAMIRIEAAEQKARQWRIIAIASAIVSLIALAGRVV
jgi:hypothetical protein